MPIESEQIEEISPASPAFYGISTNGHGKENRPSGRLVVAIAAATSALVGGLAAAWYYRRTISRLQQAALNGPDSKFGISESTDDDGQ